MQIVVRAAVMFVFIWIVMRAMGRKELSEMSPFDLIIMVVMGDLIQQGVTQNDTSLTGAITAVSTFVVLMIVLSYVSYRSGRARTLLEGVPAVVVRNGEPVDEVLKYERLTLDEVKGAAREQGIADLRQVSLGLIEADGKFSFIRFDDERPNEQPEHQT
jgi:uncharacterized membrane protein YcaP (DUF421 family)